MRFTWVAEKHETLFAITPAVGVERLWCEKCESFEGWALHLGWLLWSVSLVLDFGDRTL